MGTKNILPFPPRPRIPLKPLESAAKAAKVVTPPKRTLREVLRKVGVTFEVWQV